MKAKKDNVYLLELKCGMYLNQEDPSPSEVAERAELNNVRCERAKLLLRAEPDSVVTNHDWRRPDDLCSEAAHRGSQADVDDLPNPEDLPKPQVHDVDHKV